MVGIIKLLVRPTTSIRMHCLKLAINTLLGMFALLIAYIQLRKMVSMTMDDAYITFTYAKNAASGNGFVFATGGGGGG